MQPDDDTLNALIEAHAKALGLAIEPEWMASVRAHLAVSYRLAGVVEEVELADESEPAPVYEA
ncbi:MAG: DUF4089 domain-containing protein [Hyphomicrobiaceae bacterium]|nr:DUF4089 domain-containing protein [Hyphomicrobiaceae bacterium]